MKRSVVFFMGTALVMSGALVGTAQQRENSTADFSFTMQNTSGTMSLACEHGCAWKTLHWWGGVAQTFRSMTGEWLAPTERKTTARSWSTFMRATARWNCLAGVAVRGRRCPMLLYPRERGLTKAAFPFSERVSASRRSSGERRLSAPRLLGGREPIRLSNQPSV